MGFVWVIGVFSLYLQVFVIVQINAKSSNIFKITRERTMESDSKVTYVLDNCFFKLIYFPICMIYCIPFSMLSLYVCVTFCAG